MKTKHALFSCMFLAIIGLLSHMQYVYGDDTTTSIEQVKSIAVDTSDQKSTSDTSVKSTTASWEDEEDEEDVKPKGPPNPLWGTPNDFSHLLHVQREKLKCAECHKGMSNVKTIKEIKPIPSTGCVKCHDEKNFVDYNPKKFPTVDPSFKFPHKTANVSLVFSHKTHAKGQKMECTDCHGKPIEKMGEINTTPNMTSCMSCHVKKTDNTCMTCHNKLEKPINHFTTTWKSPIGHGFDAKLSDKACMTCHRENQSCNTCHQGLNAKKAHKPGYKFSHGMDVKFRSMDCSNCHKPLKPFCGDCHENKGKR